MYFKYRKYFLRLLIQVSCLLNVILGGKLNQSFSARNYGWQINSRRNVVRTIDFVFGRTHCQKAWEKWVLNQKK